MRIAPLMLCTALMGAAPAPSVYLNHFYLTLDRGTYAAITASAFLKTRFGPFEQRTTVRTDRSYTGAYFYGRNTYFEFFDSSKDGARRPGDSAIAFGVEEEGGIARLASKMPSASSPTLITRGLEGRQVPWFNMLVWGDLRADARFNSWVMEYHPDFLAEWHPARAGNSGIGRAALLRRYVSVLKDAPAAPLLEDVRAITIALDPATAMKLSEQCKACGFSGQKGVWEGPDFRLTIVNSTSEAGFGVREVRLRVSGMPEGQHQFRLGRSELRFEPDREAVWRFPAW